MTVRIALAVVLAAGCGHIGYDAVDAEVVGEDAPDAMQPLHEYRLEGDYTDEYGGPDLTGVGGMFTAGGYQFGPNQGLGVAGAMPATVYTVDLVFSFDNLDSWKKILDYQDLTTDEGFYTYDPNLQFVIVAGSEFATGAAMLAPNTTFQATITRDAAGLTTGYVDRVQQWQFDDAAGVATLPSPGAVVHFFVDDAATGGGEAAGGTVRRIRIWDRALTAAELMP